MTGIRSAEELDIPCAVSDFESAEKAAANSIYCGESVPRSAVFYRELIRSSATDGIPELLCSFSYICEFVPSALVEYFTALKAIKNNVPFPFVFAKNSFYDRHLSALSMIADHKIYDAQKKLRELSLDNSLPYYMSYKVLCDLEKCADELGDMRLAYSSSKRKLELMEKIRI